MKYLRLYEEFIFSKGKDDDNPGNRQVIVFDDSEKYAVEGDTHAGLSHAIKHYGEFYPDRLNVILNDALDFIKSKPNIILNSTKSNELLAKGEEAKGLINANTVLNTFDLINDKILNNKELTEEEREIKEKFLNRLESEYNSLVDEYIENSVDIDGKTQDEIQRLIGSKTKIGFKGVYKGTRKDYILDPVNTGILSKSNNVVETLFRIDKKGGDLSKVAEYFYRGVEVESVGLKSILNIL